MDRQVQPAIKSAFGPIVRINLMSLHACLFGWAAWHMWPDSLQGYGWGLLAIVAWLVCGVSSLNVIKQIVTLYTREKAIAKFLEQGKQPKSSTLASGDALDKAGMR